MTHIVVAAPPQFDFVATVHSHGWLTLPPYSWDADSESLRYILQTRAGAVLRLEICASDQGLRVDLPHCDRISQALECEIGTAVKRMLNLDWDLRPFYAAMRAHAGYDWLERERRGRILVCPSLWEDLAKVLLTTNCSWSQTVNMTSQLCQLGKPHASLAGCHAFPSPQRIADMAFDDLAQSVRAGYRTAWRHELARKIANGEIDPEAWRSLDSASLFKSVKELKGFGDYAAGTGAPDEQAGADAGSR